MRGGKGSSIGHNALCKQNIFVIGWQINLEGEFSTQYFWNQGPARWIWIHTGLHSYLDAASSVSLDDETDNMFHYSIWREELWRQLCSIYVYYSSFPLSRRVSKSAIFMYITVHFLYLEDSQHPQYFYYFSFPLSGRASTSAILILLFLSSIWQTLNIRNTYITVPFLYLAEHQHPQYLYYCSFPLSVRALTTLTLIQPGSGSTSNHRDPLCSVLDCWPLETTRGQQMRPTLTSPSRLDVHNRVLWLFGFFC
jgi:hypothetical protein